MSKSFKKSSKNDLTSTSTPAAVSVTKLPNSPIQHKTDSKSEKWRQSESSKGEKMAKKALEEESGGSSSFPIALKALELCPAPTRHHTNLLLSGYLAVKTSGGWTRKWQCRYIVLTPTFIYIFKRQPTATEGIEAVGPEISALQAKATANTRLFQPDHIDPFDNAISSQILNKVLSAAETNTEGNQELFGQFRDGMPIDNDLAILEVSTLPHTFQLSYPGRPRLLLRAANDAQFRLWLNCIRSAVILRSNPPQVISTWIAQNQGSATLTEELELAPYLNELLPAYLDRTAIITSTILHSTKIGLAAQTLAFNESSTNGTQSSPQARQIVNSFTLNSSLITKNTVSNENSPHQGLIITHIAPWGKKINVILNNLLNPSNTFDNILANDAITLTLGDGGQVTIPLANLYGSYQQHVADRQLNATPSNVHDHSGVVANTSADNNTPGDSVGQNNHNHHNNSTIIDNYADGLFVVSNSSYNCDIHLAFRFNKFPASKKDKTGNDKRGKATPASAASAKGNAKNASKKSTTHAAPSGGSTIAAVINTIISVYLAINLHYYIDTTTTQGTCTLWLLYFILAMFIFRTLGGYNIPLRDNIAENPQAIHEIITQYGGAAGTTATTSGDPNTTAAAAAAAGEQMYHVLEVIPIRIVDRHTLTGAVLLGGIKYDNHAYHPLPQRTVLTPSVSLLNALHHEIGTDPDDIFITGNGSSGGIDVDLSDDEDEDLSDDNVHDMSRIHKNVEEEVYEMDAELGRIYLECWGKWGQSDYSKLRLRGPDYLSNSKRVKIPALPHVYRTCCTSITASKVAQPHAANWIGSYFHTQRKRAIELGKGHLWERGTPLKYMVINMIVPGNPNYNFVHYFRNPYIYPSPYPDDIVNNIQQKYHETSPDAVCEYWGEDEHPIRKLIDDFVDGDDAYRTSRFKYIPTVAKGGWVITKTVGQTPVILGNKLKQTYHVDSKRQYIEIDIDVSSSSMAGSVLSMVKSYAKTIALDLNYLLEPHHPEELPEGLWGGARVIDIDLDSVETIDPKPTPPEEYS